MGLLSFALKSSIAGGAVYFTIQEGIWSSPEEAGKIYKKIYSFFNPYVIKNVPPELLKELQHIPNPGNFRSYAATYWNKGVSTSANFLANLPDHISDGINKIKKEIEKSSLNTEVAITTEKK